VFDHFCKYHMQILLGNFNAQLGTENVSKLTIGNDSLHQDSNDNSVRRVNFVTSRNVIFKRTMFSHRKILKYTWTSPDGNIGHILIDRRWESSILDV